MSRLRWLKLFWRWMRMREEYRVPVEMIVLTLTHRAMGAPPADGLEITAWAFPRDSKYGSACATMPVGPYSRRKPEPKTVTTLSGETSYTNVDFGGFDPSARAPDARTEQPPQ